MSLDFKKAFHTINWEFMYQCSKNFNFGENFISFVRILYCDPSSVVKNNGYLSKKIQIERGFRQGGPLSAILFILYVEILAIKSMKIKILKGLILIR